MNPAPNPVLSIVVPAYGVEAYLHQCLESIIADLPGADAAAVEVVAVNDASPDRCGEVLRAYALAYGSRVRTVDLPSNVGLGPARNAGLDVATGRYVWFVDGDDWLPPGAVAAVLNRLRRQQPDVLIVDHLRMHENGRREVDPSSRLLRGVDGVVRLADRPELLRVQHTAWNKVVRRQLLAELDLRFFPGWYEDVPFSHPLLIGAKRIAVLDRVCYHYRQGRPGAITSTRSERHLDAFEQYGRLFDWLDRRATDDGVRAEVFALMMSHYLVVAGNDDRLHPRLRRVFFRRVAADYRRYLPAGGYPRPSGVTGLKHRLVARDSYLLYAALRKAHRAAGRFGGPRGGNTVGTCPTPADALPASPGTAGAAAREQLATLAGVGTS